MLKRLALPRNLHGEVDDLVAEPLRVVGLLYALALERLLIARLRARLDDERGVTLEQWDGDGV